MSDAADRADELVESVLDGALHHVRHSLRTRALAPCGVCHWCSESLANAAALYCDGECAAEHAADQRRVYGVAR